ncbi:MAG: acyl-CoA dehydrogenase family protein [Deltaproteobacteria bacterium]|nr:acyl-CoA dehydrogenase family protein [Deltaproteobacteria bacterium]MDQ3299172.1 acyl-CoA dehydrogenase family protein [Myxococcota bacterium]
MKLSSDDLPMFFAEPHRALADRLRSAAATLAAIEAPGAHADEASRDRAAVDALARANLLELVVPTGTLDTRALCLAREMLGYVSPRADSIFAVQGLGTHPIVLAGNAEQRLHLQAFARGAGIAAFALTEPEAGSDVASIQTRAAATADGYRLDGDKLFISNLGIADHATVIATTDPTLGAGGLTAFWLPLETPGVTVKPMQAIAPHPIGSLELRGVMVPAAARIGEVGQGMKLAMRTLDAFRVSVGAAAVGMARRALDEAVGFVTQRSQFGKLLSEQPLVQAHLADMVVDLDSARLLVLRAAYLKDTTKDRVTTEVSIAKLGATEAAQRVIDRAVQLFGGRGVMTGAVVEHLYRAIRPLRIYEGTSEIQRTIIGRALARGAT